MKPTPDELVPWHDAIAMVGRGIFGSQWSGDESATLYRQYHMYMAQAWTTLYGEAYAKLAQDKGHAAAEAFRAGQFSGKISEAASDAERRRVLGAERYDEICSAVRSGIPGADAAERWNAARSQLVEGAASGQIFVGVQRGSLLTPEPVLHDFWNREGAARATMTGEVAGIVGIPSGPLLVRASDIARSLQREGSTGHVMSGVGKAKLLRDLRLFLEPIAAKLGENPPQAERPIFDKLLADAKRAIGGEVPRDALRDMLRDAFPNLKRDRGRSGEG